MSFPWNHTRRFNAYSEYFKNYFGERIQKLSINAGMNCPNRDGTIAYGGCTYCNNDAFNPSYCDSKKTIHQQITEGIEFHAKRYRRAKKYLAYFQTFSNTYAPLSKLKEIYNEALSFPEVVGLVIGTRPDCINTEKLRYLKELSEKYYVIVEYGVETINNKTLSRINRGHTYEQSVEALQMTANAGIKTGAHFIFGLPGETKEEMLDSVKLISSLPLTTIKFHQLQIIKNTVLAKEYYTKQFDFPQFSLDEYIDFIVSFTERLNPAFVIERFAGEVPPRFLAGPGWEKIRNDQILNRIEHRLTELNTWQGKYFYG